MKKEIPLFIQKINWTDLKNQKEVLVGLISTNMLGKIISDNLEGILALIDAIQDYAVDEAKIVKENDVFDLEDETCTHGLHIPSYTLETNETKTVYICTHCGSDNVQVKAWMRPNKDNQYVDEVNEGDEPGWCDDCDLTAIIETAELKADAKVIGFQVVGEDGTSEEGEIHPDMDASFCIYNLSQARKMLNKKNVALWRLLTIWEGDVEEPTFMFEGNPRD